MSKNFNFTSIKEVDIQAKKDSVDVEGILANIDRTPLKWHDYDIYPGVKLAGVIDEYTDEQVLELKKCMHPTKGIFHFALNYVYVLHPMKGMIQWEPREYQIRLLQAFLDHRFNIIMASRQVGKSTIAMIFMLWRSMFFENQIIAVLAHKADGAKDVLSRIKDAYEMLPSWMKPGSMTYNKMTIEFENGSKIFGNSTTKDAIRGKSCTYVYLDEFAHVPPNIAQDFWISNYPTISTGGHIIIVSTPNGVGNLYHRLWKGAQTNDKLGFNWEQVDYWEVPDRDEAWKEETIAQLGSIILFNQEHGNKFIGSVETLIDHEILEKLIGTIPLEEREDGVTIFRWPEENRRYVIGVDPAEGKDQDYSIGQVFDITQVPWIQVAKFKSNNIALVDLPYKLKDLGEEYNDAWIAVESNNQGLSVLADLAYDIGYEYLVHMGKKVSDLGIFNHKKIRSDACALIKKAVENIWVEFLDDETINELMDFGPKAGKYQGLNGNDDLVMASLWAVYFNQSEMFKSDAKENKIVWFDFKKGMEVVDNWDIIDAISQGQYENELNDVALRQVRKHDSPWARDEQELREFLIN